MLEDRVLQLLENSTGLDPELVHERLPRLLVHGERLGLAPRAVEGEHQLTAQMLT